MEQYLTQFLDTLADEKRYADNTISAYRNDLTQFWEYLRIEQGGAVNLAAVTPELLAAYVTSLQSNGQSLANSTVARRIAAVKAFFSAMVARGVVATDPTVHLTSPKIKKIVPKSLSEEDMARLLAAPGRSGSPKSLRDRALLELLYATGMRVSEIVNLRLDDINWETGEITCPGKGDRRRRLPLASAAEPLAEYLHRGRPAFTREESPATLFLNQRGQRLTRQGIWLILREAAEAVGLEGEVTPHTLRHSFAQHKVGLGEDMRQLQHLLGHANLSTTQVYRSLVAADTSDGSTRSA
jgi:integrase/recombinase XerD